MLIFLSGCEARHARKKDSSPIQVSPGFLFFGTLREGDIRSGSFFVQNTCSNEVQVLNIEPSCSCTKLDIAHFTLKPGEIEKVTVSLDSSHHYGRFGTTIKIFGRRFNGSMFTYETYVGANSLTVANATPAELDLGVAYLEDPPKNSETIIESGGANLAWSGIKAHSRAVSCAVEQLGPKRYRLTVYTPANPLNCIGRFTDKLQIELLDHGVSRGVCITVPVKWNTRSHDVTVVPLGVYLGKLRLGVPKAGTIQIEGVAGEKLTLESTATENLFTSDLYIKAAPTHSINTLLFNYSMTSSHSGIISGCISLTVSQQRKTYSIRIPFLGFSD